MEKVVERQDNYIEQIKLNNKEIKMQKDNIVSLKESIDTVLTQLKLKEDSRRKIAGKVGGLTASLNKEKEKTENLLEDKVKLENTIKDLETKLEESMSNKYLVRKIPSGRRPKTQTMKTKNCSVPSNIARNMFERNK